jgi:hypothetical protein
MKTLALLGNVRTAVKHLNPNEVREQSGRPLSVALVSSDPATLVRMQEFLCPPSFSPAKCAQVSSMIDRVPPSGRRRAYDIELWDASLAQPETVFSFDPQRPEACVDEILAKRPELALPLARYFAPFRKPVIDGVIRLVAKENAFFSIATAIPDIVPLLSIPWALGEWASDTAFLTMNQVRMVFLIAAASDHHIGYREQKAEIGSILAGAFGFRAIARELVGHIPLGGGLIPKAAIAWSGTYVVGRSMERLYLLGYGYTDQERKSAVQAAFEKGREVAAAILATLRRQPV